jgi:hypothetical protein
MPFMYICFENQTAYSNASYLVPSYDLIVDC